MVNHRLHLPLLSHSLFSAASRNQSFLASGKVTHCLYRERVLDELSWPELSSCAFFFTSVIVIKKNCEHNLLNLQSSFVPQH